MPSKKSKKKNYSLQSKRKINMAQRTEKRKKSNNVLLAILVLTAVSIISLAVILSINSNGEKDNGKAAATPTTVSNSKVENTTKVSIQTDKGEIVLGLRPDLMPKTVENFMKLVKEGFFDGLTFHRVLDWVIQGGDPTLAGRPEPDWTIDLETNPKLKNVRYAVGMARLNEDINSANSQFYILREDKPLLNGDYAIFGTVIEGQEVVDKIIEGDKMKVVKEVGK